MAKKTFNEDALDNIISGITSPLPQASVQEIEDGEFAQPAVKKVGRKKKDVTHVTISLPTSTATRLKALSIKTGQTASSIVDYVLSKVLDKYEEANGKLTIVPNVKKELSDFLD